MCLLICRKPGSEIPMAHLRNAFASNPHGAGYAYIRNGRVVIRRGFKDFRSFEQSYKTADPKSPHLIHFRWATHGPKSKDNCHPFRLPHGIAMGHNGIISIATVGDESDTRAFIGSVLTPDLTDHGAEILEMPSFQRYIENQIGYSKLAFLRPDGSFIIYNEDMGDWVDGVWYSNKSYEEKPYYSVSSCNSAFDDYDYQGYVATRNPGLLGQAADTYNRYRRLTTATSLNSGSVEVRRGIILDDSDEDGILEHADGYFGTLHTKSEAELSAMTDAEIEKLIEEDDKQAYMEWLAKHSDGGVAGDAVTVEDYKSDEARLLGEVEAHEIAALVIGEDKMLQTNKLNVKLMRQLVAAQNAALNAGLDEDRAADDGWTSKMRMRKAERQFVDTKNGLRVIGERKDDLGTLGEDVAEIDGKKLIRISDMDMWSEEQWQAFRQAEAEKEAREEFDRLWPDTQTSEGSDQEIDTVDATAKQPASIR